MPESPDAIAPAKRAAALAALAELPPTGTIGLGTGSTTRLFIDALGDLVAQGRRYTGVPTSNASRAQASSLRIPLLSDDGPWSIDVTIDGADEVSPALDLIKGGGGAHTREKIVNAASRRNIIIVDESKLSPVLGTRWPVPIEVLAFAHAETARHLAAFGTPTLRAQRTDAGNVIYDLACGPIADPGALDAALHMVPGVVETGLFVGRADVVLVARAGGVERLVRP
jgi:ribose 5-phosphate isomerase A